MIFEKKLPISVFIITKDEEERITYALESVVSWVDEIIVIDSGSKDKTLEIASKYGAKIHYHEWQGFGQQKIYGESLCANDWVLNIDADEEITEEVRENIFSIFENLDPKYAAYKMYWKMLFLGQKSPPKYGVTSNFIRLYNKQKAGFRNSSIHDSVILKPDFTSLEIGEIKGFVNHRFFKNLKHWADKINIYSTMQAQEWLEKKRPKPSLRIIIEPFFELLK